MGPDAMRCANLIGSLRGLGHTVNDLGNLESRLDATVLISEDSRPKLKNLDACTCWLNRLHEAAFDACDRGQMPIFLGGDHFMSAGTVSGVARRSATEGREQFVLWLDAHPDFHSLKTTTTGNLHGTPVAYFSGQDGFSDHFPKIPVPVRPENICMLGIRSVDPTERVALQDCKVTVHDMRAIDESGVAKPLHSFLEEVRSAKGNLHVSLDVDFLDPTIAPAVGTTVPGGATFREAHLVMEILHESDLVTSLDIAELNPFLDERGQTATLMVDLVASLMGRKVLDRPTSRY